MSQDLINYQLLVDKAMLNIVKEALKITAKNNLQGDHHFFISFTTFHPMVVISEKLKARYPQEMTIVIQHQFEDLDIHNNYFSVSLSFDGVKEKITVPFEALTAFADPSVKFGLQFKHLIESGSFSEFIEESTQSDDDNELEDSISGSNVINIDSFRKKF